MKRLVLISLTVLMFLVSLFPVKVSADNGKLTAEHALRILQSVNPNIANYDIETHLVTFKDGSKPVFVTPKGENPQNGEVSWEYFIQQKGDLRGWLKYPVEKMVEEKTRMIRDFKTKHGITFSTTASTGYPDSAIVDNCKQFPQQCNNWCGPAATESVLSGWGIGSPSIPVPSQSEIASREGVTCNSNYGTKEDGIANTLNYYIGENWYYINHWGYDPQNLWLIVYVDIGNYEAFVSECDTIYLRDWRENVSDGKTYNRVHYIAVRGYWTPSDSTPVENDWQKATIAYTDSATSIHPELHAYVSGQNFYCGVTYTQYTLPPRDRYILNPWGYTSFYNATIYYPEIG